MSYLEERYNIIKQFESSGVAELQPYVDSKGLITIGVGFNINYTENKAVSEFILKKFGLNDTFTTPEAQSANQKYRDQIIAELKVKRIPNEKPTIIQGILNNIMKNRANDKALQSYNLSTRFEFASEQAVKDTFNDPTFITQYENKVISFLIGRQGEGSLFIARDELLALFSLGYNQKEDGTKLLGDGLGWAIQYGNRAEAWYQIRYVSNGDKSNGIAKRRYAESEIFGLYANPSNPTDQELKDFYRMYQRKQKDISAYESSYGKQIDEANLDLDKMGRSENVDTLKNIEKNAKDILVDHFGQGITIDNILVGYDTGYENSTSKNKENIDDADLKGTEKNDLIFGEKGKDTLIGGAGSDVLYGGEEDDVLVGNIYGPAINDEADYLDGGEGKDTYVTAKDDRIHDSDGNGLIYFNSVDLSGTKTKMKDAENIYEDDDFTYQEIEGKLLVI
ncbi:MAG: hypothetical protein JXK50_06695, partial [Campylobacterales bacterium]|nr:hypothetical protein [Campylobacterales bacterium]